MATIDALDAGQRIGPDPETYTAPAVVSLIPSNWWVAIQNTSAIMHLLSAEMRDRKEGRTDESYETNGRQAVTHPARRTFGAPRRLT